MKHPPLLLDTHVWLWSVLEPERLSETSRVILRESSAAGVVLVSVISVWETAMLHAKGRLQLELPCREWVRKALDVPGLRVAPLTVDIAVESTRLELHPDPADRMLVATALALQARLITADRRLLQYGALHSLPFLPA